MGSLPWDMIGAIIGGLSFLLTLLVEWNKLGTWRRIMLALVVGAFAFFIVNLVAPLVFPPKSTSATMTPIPGTILFQDNFDDGKSDKWNENGGIWEVVQDENGNYVYQGDASSNGWIFAAPKISSFTWQNYAIELRWRVVKISDQNDDNDADGQVTFRVQYDKPSGCSYYGVFFDTAQGFVSLARQGFNPDCEWANLVDRHFGFQTGEWYNLLVETSETNHEVFVNGALFLQASDASVTQGIFEIDAAPGAIVQFDDVKVWIVSE